MCFEVLTSIPETAQVNGAMQAAQMAQVAVDAAQENYASAVAKQAQTAAAMAEVQKKLKALQETLVWPPRYSKSHDLQRSSMTTV